MNSKFYFNKNTFLMCLLKLFYSVEIMDNAFMETVFKYDSILLEL